MATANTRSTTWPAERNMPILGHETSQFFSEGYWQNAFNHLGFRKNMPIMELEQTQSISEGYCQHTLNSLGCRKKYALIGTRTNTVYFRRLLLALLKLPCLQKEICRYWDSNQHSLFPKTTGNTRSTTWALERNMPILGLEPTQFISEGYCQQALNSLD